jgi:hypothetical protein
VNDLLRELRSRLRLPFWHRADIEAELQSHLAEVETELRTQGADEESARRGARERFGDAETVAEALQSVHHGWGGGATVRARGAGTVLSLVVAGVVSGSWWDVALHQFRLPLWCALCWYLAAVAVGWHRSASDRVGGWIWAAFSLCVGPVAWVAYLVLLRTRYLSRPVDRSFERLLWAPRAAVLAVVIIVGAPVFSLPLEAAGLDIDYARSGLQALSRSAWGTRLLFRAANSSRPTLRAAALQELPEGVEATGRRRPAFHVSQWTLLLRSPYARTRRVAWERLNGLLMISYREVEAEELFAAWKTALESRDPELAASAWNAFGVDLVVNGVNREFRPIAGRIADLLRLGKGNRPENRQALANAVEGAIRVGCPGVNPDDYGIPLEQQAGLLPLAPVWVEICGEQSIGEVNAGDVGFGTREPGAKPPAPPYRVTTTGPSLEAWAQLHPRPREPHASSITVYYAITARGPVGKHEEWIRLTGGNGSRVGLVRIAWTEVAHPVQHCPLWEAARPRREARLARLRALGHL